ncbi:unannotated protein [freshwater metagenome]|uniref:Unannotated protein n=1 Tax=freshwater metagenome TaxID=449393 RepID=A0A6J7XQR3_9ZZZZ|nr:bifunctional phosphopantothenoylcysteine decarboxylase/phosphopantothenate--cysteine ligase CoaBC [Actinomycetota bacterium]
MKSRNRELILGIGGGIAAYKSCELLRRFQDSGFGVTVIPTPSSLNFVGLATWEALSGREVTTGVFQDVKNVRHISLAHDHGAIVIAPATADLIARLAAGRADDLLTNVVLASTSPKILVPAMHPAMWKNPATMENIRTLKERGFHVITPDVGRLTGEDVGIGRFPTVERIIKECTEFLNSDLNFIGKKVLVSAGGTREAIDPVRYIGNRSSGKQGYAIATSALDRGAQVVLVLANSALPDLPGATTIRVETAQEMSTALHQHFPECDLLAMAAAVSDARPVTPSSQKIKKDKFTSIELTQNPDILASLAASKKRNQIIIGFAAETQLKPSEAREKLAKKGADIAYVNDVSQGAIFGQDVSSGVLFTDTGEEIVISDMEKDTLAHIMLDCALSALS